MRTHCSFVFSLCDEWLSTPAFSFYFPFLYLLRLSWLAHCGVSSDVLLGLCCAGVELGDGGWRRGEDQVGRAVPKTAGVWGRADVRLGSRDQIAGWLAMWLTLGTSTSARTCGVTVLTGSRWRASKSSVELRGLGGSGDRGWRWHVSGPVWWFGPQNHRPPSLGWHKPGQDRRHKSLRRHVADIPRMRRIEATTRSYGRRWMRITDVSFQFCPYGRWVA